MKDRIVWLILTLMCTVLSGPLFAGVLPGPNGGVDLVESRVPAGVYLDFTYRVDGKYDYDDWESPTNPGIKCTIDLQLGLHNGNTWGFPDTSSTTQQVDGDGDGNGDCFDSKDHNKAAEFKATISGLVPSRDYEAYIMARHEGGSYAYAWGTGAPGSGSDNQVDPTGHSKGIKVSGGDPLGDGSRLYPMPQGGGVFTSDGSGNLVFYFDVGADRTMYGGILVRDATINPPPDVEAGPSQAFYAPETRVTLAGSATDEGPADGTSPGEPGGVQSFYWFVESGPAAVVFEPNALVYDPNVLFSAPGTYKIVLQVSDGYQDANDTMQVTVMGPAEMLGYWPFDGDADDHGDNAVDSHGTLAMPEGGLPDYDSDAAMGTYSIVTGDLLNDPNTNEPNDFPHIDLGVAAELDFSTNDFTVSAWIKTLQIKGGSDDGKGVIFINGADAVGGHRYMLINNENANGAVCLVTDDDVDKVVAYGSTTYPMNDEIWHFVVGMRRGNQLRLYCEGVLDDTAGLPDNYDLSGTSAWNSRIGLAEKFNGKFYKSFDGKIDDVRVYNYALTDPVILAMWNAGPHVATVTARADFQFYWETGLLPKPLSGVVTDTGAGGQPLGGYTSILWTSDDPGGGQASFTLATDPNTTVTFPGAGVYTLSLTVADLDAVTTANPGGNVVETVVVTVVQATCADVDPTAILAYDFTGGAGGAPDCYITMADLLYLLTDWAECNDPQDAACTWPF